MDRKMKKILSVLTVILLAISLFNLKGIVAAETTELKNAVNLLKARNDRQAGVIFEKILQQEPQNLQALWGKAELLRRQRKFKESEALLNQIFKIDPDNASALITLAYIRYMEENYKDALRAVNRVLELKDLERENRALAYMMMGTINSGRSSKGWLLAKVGYGAKIQSYFLKAKEIAPELPEVHLGLGIFYLKAPSLMGGNINKSIEELETAVKMTPDFATANARLAQAYKKNGDLDKYRLYLQKAIQLDPGNEVLQELKKEK